MVPAGTPVKLLRGLVAPAKHPTSDQGVAPILLALFFIPQWWAVAHRQLLRKCAATDGWKRI